MRQPPARPGRDLPSLRAELTDDQLRALVDCTHPTVADVPAGERSPCPDCGLAWCQALAAINIQHYELPDGRTFASFADSDVEPCERRAIGARRDGRTFCTAHQAGGDVLIVTPAEGGSRRRPHEDGEPRIGEAAVRRLAARLLGGA